MWIFLIVHFMFNQVLHQTFIVILTVGVIKSLSKSIITHLFNFHLLMIMRHSILKGIVHLKMEIRSLSTHPHGDAKSFEVYSSTKQLNKGCK